MLLSCQVGGEKEVEVGRAALSNMVGGIGYFHGQSRIAIPAEFKVTFVSLPLLIKLESVLVKFNVVAPKQLSCCVKR